MSQPTAKQNKVYLLKNFKLKVNCHKHLERRSLPQLTILKHITYKLSRNLSSCYYVEFKKRKNSLT